MWLEVLETGGTINGILSPDQEPPARSLVVDWLQRHAGSFGIHPSARILCMKDSRAITDTDRDRLRAAVESSTADAILVPHGTYTMAETGRYLQAHLGAGAHARCVVLVGSLQPLDSTASDGPEALRFAIEFLLDARPGVWVTMGDGPWSPQAVEKDPGSGRFRQRVSPPAP